MDMKLLFIALLGGCMIELKTSQPREGSYSNYQDSDYYNERYDNGYSESLEPDYISWDCWDDNYYWDSTIDVDVIDCYAYDIEVEIEYFDYNIEYDTLIYLGDCDWYTSLYVENYECAEIYNVTVTAYY